MTRIPRPRRLRPEDLDVVMVTPADVERCFAPARTGKSSSAYQCSPTSGRAEIP